MQKERASKKQQELLSFVDGFIKGNGYGPSYREIMRALGYKSVSTVAIHVDGLIAKGYLARRDNSARSLEVVTMRPEEVRSASQDSSLESELHSRIKPDLDESDRLKIKEVLILLGLDDLAETINTKEDAKK